MNLHEGQGALALKIAQTLSNAGFVAYFAGGCVRDDLMGRVPEDYDIVTSATPDDVERLFQKTVAVGKQFGVMVVVLEEMQFEVATFREEGEYLDGRHPTKVNFSIPEKDALRRDFTVNGLFYDPLGKKVLDFVGGVQDLKDGLIRAIGNAKERFEEDKLRLMRAVRFTSSLGFKIESKTWAAIKEMAPQIKVVSPERIRDELVKVLTRPQPHVGYKLLSESGLMKEILPEIEAMKGVEQQPDYHPEGDVFVHTGLLLEKLGENPSPMLALSALFHDVAKPTTFDIKKGKITFYEHAPIGAKMTEVIMRRLRFSNDEIKLVCEAVENHMKFGDAQKMRSGKLKRFVARSNFEMELELHRIDCESCHGMLDNYYFLKEKIKEFAAEELKPIPYLNGHDLIKAGVQKGPRMKVLLEEAYDLQLEKSLQSRDEALQWLQEQPKR